MDAEYWLHAEQKEELNFLYLTKLRNKEFISKT